MFNTTHNHVHEDHSVHFPDTINVHEHKAPTDESIKMLHEMEEKARESVIAHICDERPRNDFHFDIVVVKIASVEALYPKFMLYFRTTVNGKEYERKVPVDGANRLMGDIMLVGGGRHGVVDFSGEVQRFLFLQFCALVSSILLDVNNSAVESLMKIVAETGAHRMDFSKLETMLKDWERYDFPMIENR